MAGFRPDTCWERTRTATPATITLDETGDNYTSTATNDLLDLNGNVIASGCATTAATRFSPE